MHNIEYFTYKENVDKKKVISYLNDYVARQDRQEGCSGLYRDIRWLDVECDTYEEAIKYIENHDRGDYDNLAVKYKNYANVEIKPAKACESLKIKIAELTEKKRAYETQHGVHNFKSSYIGCSRCGSKINREYLKGNRCPVCGEDLRGKTTLDTLKRYDERIKEATEALKEEQLKNKKKHEKKAKTEWIVKIEYHT